MSFKAIWHLMGEALAPLRGEDRASGFLLKMLQRKEMKK